MTCSKCVTQAAYDQRFQVAYHLKLDLDLIEVSNGKSLKISKRKYICTPLKENDFRKTSPRIFTSYDSSVEPDAKFFSQKILNSFPDPETRVKFLNKFYRCLMASKMPHKVRKLFIHGPKDSGKTSWINVLLGMIPMTDVASITQERQFAAAMIEDTPSLWCLMSGQSTPCSQTWRSLSCRADLWQSQSSIKQVNASYTKLPFISL